jgi:hypothetical protein
MSKSVGGWVVINTDDWRVEEEFLRLADAVCFVELSGVAKHLCVMRRGAFDALAGGQ